MPDPEEFSFYTPREKGPELRVGEEFVIKTVVTFDELAVRVQILEKVIARAPFLGLDYSRELKRAGLERKDLFTTKAFHD